MSHEDQTSPALDEQDAHVLAPFRLTPKQEQILRLLLAGDTNPTIARKLYLPRTTVAFHLARIYRKLQVDDRLGAIARVRSELR